MTAYDALPAGAKLADRFIIETRIGHGQFAAVYKALDRPTASYVALKVLNPSFAEDPVTQERFLREVKILRSLDHPNIVKVYDVIHQEPWSIICMEWFDGSDCGAYLDRHGPMPVADFLPVAATMVSAVQACHRLKIVHRDLKPQNVLINARHEIKLVDFGMSKMQAMPDLTRTGTIVGTPQYLAPEMFRSTRADPRSDIYALGAIFYELLTNRPPYRGQTLAEVMTRQLRSAVEDISTVRPDVPAWLTRIVLTCLRIDPSNRYQSCYELGRDLASGERATRPAADAVTCVHCQAALLPGLPFCHQCGQLRQLVLEPGRSSVLLQRCEEPRALQVSLERTFPGARADLVARLSRLPVVLARGVSAATARTMVHQLAAVPCELRVTDRLATAVELPVLYAVLAFAAVVTLICTAVNLSQTARVGMIVGTELMIIGLYRIRTQPAIRSPARQTRAAAGVTDPVLLSLLCDLKKIGDPGLKTILGNLLRSFLVLRDRIRGNPTVVEVETIRRAVSAALQGARLIEAQEIFLASTNVSDLHARLRAVEARLAATVPSAEVDALITTKTNLERDRKNYCEVQDAHATTYVALVNLQGVLQRIEDGLGSANETADAAAELRSLEEDLVRRQTNG